MTSTENTEHGTRNTPRSAERSELPTLRSAAFVDERNTNGVDTARNGTRNTEHGTLIPAERSAERSAPVERSAEATERPAGRNTSTEQNASGTEHGTERSVPESVPQSVPQRWRFRSSAERTAARNDVTERKALAEQVQRDLIAMRQQAAVRTAAALRRSATRSRSTRKTAEQIAPLPNWMVVIGVWFDRTLGALPLVAPLLVSAYFTTRVMTDKPVNAPLVVAILITLALEGGVWKLAKLLERTLLEGDSTISLRAGILGYLTLISGGIFGHAYYKAYDRAGSIDKVQLSWGDWLPAAATAVMSLLGVYIWSRQARFQHRVELRDMGLIDTQAPKFSLLAWVFVPLETPLAFRHAIKFRITSPLVAVSDRRLWKDAGKPKVWNVGVADPHGTEQPEENTDQGNAPLTVPSFRMPPFRTDRQSERNTGNGTEHPDVERSALDEFEADLTGRNAPLADGTEQNAERNAPNGTVQRNADMPARNTTTVHGANGGGTRNGTERSGTRNADGTQDGVSAELVKLAPYLLDVVSELRDWKTNVPSVRAVTAAISAARVRRGEGTFKSASVSMNVARELRRLAGEADGADQIEQFRSN